MRVFKHLNFTDRLRIEKWKKEGMRTREIAEKLRVDPSTVYRELKRGSYDRLDGKTWEMIPTYSPDIAEQRYQANLREKGPGLKIGKDHELAAYIERTIVEQDCSPAAVYGYAMEQGKVFKTHISIPTIYNYIKKGVFLNMTQVALPRHGVHKNEYKKVKKKKAARAPAGESIEKRPEEIQSREEFGHWEMDTVYSGKKKSTTALLVLTERKTRMIELGDAFIAFPGGTGTLEEITEVISKLSLGQLDAPCILYDLNGYYQPLHQLLQQMIAMGLSTPARQQNIAFAADLAQIRAILEK